MVNIQIIKNKNMLTGARYCVLNVLYRQQFTYIVFWKQNVEVNNVWISSPIRRSVHDVGSLIWRKDLVNFQTKQGFPEYVAHYNVRHELKIIRSISI